MPRFIPLANEETAVRFVKAMNRIRGLPRCDHPKWGDPNVVVLGKLPEECGCTDRATPLDDCRFATRDHVGVDRVGNVFGVKETPEIIASAGRRISIEGTNITIRATGARNLVAGEVLERVRGGRDP